MIAKITSAILNWLLTALIIPGAMFIYDVFRLRKENKELKLTIEKLKNAKTSADIDSSIDDIN